MTKDEKNPVCDAINAAIQLMDDPQIFDVKAPIKLAALSPDERYRQVALKDEEFFLKGIRPGKKSEYIIELKPVSAAGYVQAELLDKDLPQVMPELEKLLVSLLGHSDVRFRTAAKRFLNEHKAKEEQAAQKAESIKYDANPSWGSF